MPQARGRAVSGVRVDGQFVALRTPLLIRSYLQGERFPGDTAAQARERPTQGDYISRIHRRVKRRIKELSPTYQYSRYHSSKAFIHHLIKLGLLEKTGRQQKSKLDSKMNAKPRIWVRLTPGSATRVEWADPMGYLALLYPGIRPPGRELATKVPTRRRRPPRRRVAAVRPRERPPRVAPISPTVLRDLEGVRKQLVLDLRQASARGETIELFEGLRDRASAFLSRVNLIYGRTVYVEGRRDLDLLANCVRLLREAATAPARRPIALTNCQASARLLADEISIPLPKTVERVAEERPAFTPIDLPDELNRRAALRLITHLRQLERIGVDAPGVEEEIARLANLASDWASSARERADAESEKEEPNEERLERLEGIADALEEVSSNLENKDVEGTISALAEAFPGRAERR